ncbi:hypothetical protein OJ996_10190 [Luteolibacter sp. GHJ8]|uniref:Uncharacterized protein n=1 Tax=Luteolibacter rhizosphaerae TaxID=2989719 RepID=A0ABT3G278_9BACT|nr:hypothetical protein [Luteolibacter rhizosphaerae]MCW1913946.1 hypothetical protein [Luteolibacter rhizosphaerae]
MFARLSLFLLSASLLQGADFIRQIHSVAGQAIIYDIPTAGDQGHVNSRPLTTDSAIFQLYTSTTTNNVTTLKKLDEKTVGTFLPQVTVQALSEDPYFPPRTRADKPYGMRITIAGMQAANSGSPEYARKVSVTRSYKLYDPATFIPTGAGGEYADSFVFRENGTFTDNAILQRLPGTSPSKVSGEESFTVYLQPTGSSPQSELAKASVQIWPVADAAISNLVQDYIYKFVPPDGSVVLNDLYPKSVTYAQVYKGPQVTGSVGIPLPDTVVAYDTYAPQKAQLALSGLEEVLQDDGQYTIEILTITPFNNGAPEILAHVSFFLKRDLSIRSSVTTMEQ